MRLEQKGYQTDSLFVCYNTYYRWLLYIMTTIPFKRKIHTSRTRRISPERKNLICLEVYRIRTGKQVLCGCDMDVRKCSAFHSAIFCLNSSESGTEWLVMISWRERWKVSKTCESVETTADSIRLPRVRFCEVMIDTFSPASD